MQKVRQKLERVIIGHIRHFASSRVFFSSQGESKTLVKSEMELFVTLVNGRRQLGHVTWMLFLKGLSYFGAFVSLVVSLLQWKSFCNIKSIGPFSVSF